MGRVGTRPRAPRARHRGGPSWKPLPVVFTTPLSITGSAAPALWLIIARAGGLLAVAGAAVLATRLGGTLRRGRWPRC